MGYGFGCGFGNRGIVWVSGGLLQQRNIFGTVGALGNLMDNGRVKLAGLPTKNQSSGVLGAN